MGIDVKSKIIVGLSYEELMGCMTEEEMQYAIENYFSVLSPSYDAPSEECAFGVEIASSNLFTFGEINFEEFEAEVSNAKHVFKKWTGFDGRLLFGAHVY